MYIINYMLYAIYNTIFKGTYKGYIPIYLICPVLGTFASFCCNKKKNPEISTIYNNKDLFLAPITCPSQIGCTSTLHLLHSGTQDKGTPQSGTC